MVKILEFFGRGEDAFDRLLKPHLAHLYRLSYRFTGNESDAEELLQDLLVKLFSQHRRLDQIENLGGWLSRTLYHHFIDRKRRASREPVTQSYTRTIDEQSHAAGDEPLHAAQHRDLQQQLNHALLTLEPDQRALVVLHDMEGMHLQAIAELLDVPLGTVKSRLHRARAKLRQQIQLEPFSHDQRYRGKGDADALPPGHKTSR